VVATNSYGSGPASAASNSVTPSLNYIEEVFSTWLYTGNGSTQTITNGVDLAGKGGMVWIKNRVDVFRPILTDTVRGVNSQVFSDTDSSAAALTNIITAFNSTGFNLGSFAGSNTNANANVSWTFREQAKFFDVVTWTGTGSNTTIAHSLGAVPACIFVKRIDDFANWQVYHRSLANTQYMVLNSTAAVATGATRWNSTTPTDTVFSLGTDTTVNASGGTYVAYLFAHNAGGFGLTGTDNVISCGSYTGNGSATGPVIDLGYEPQWLLIKNASFGSANWMLFDTMRGLPVGSNPSWLYPNTSGAEVTDSWGRISPMATGFQVATSDAWLNQSGNTMIYIAVRRGPMKVPTTGTSVFAPVTRTGTNAVASITGLGFAPDAALIRMRQVAGVPNVWYDRLRGPNIYLETSSTNAEATTTSPSVTSYNNTGISFGNDLNEGLVNANGQPYINWLFGRAPGFFDEVCVTGTGADVAYVHNLGVTPEMYILKRRSATSNWTTYHAALAAGDGLWLNDNVASMGGLIPAPPTSTTFTAGLQTSSTWVAYLFASCPGVSKVGSYTGTGATQTINCGFTGGARFVLIKATSTTGNWLVWDSARGIVSGNDPYLALNSTAAEVTNTDWVDTAATGFELSNAGGNLANSSGVSYIFLAIA
jgi:hypothetical protein